MRYILTVFIFFSPFSKSIAQTDWSIFDQIKTVHSLNSEELALKITSPFPDTLDKVKAIYYWLTHNIEYDLKALKRMQKQGFISKSMSPEAIEQKKQDIIRKSLKQKKGVCQDYTHLFVALCEAIHVESAFIGGFSQSNPFESGIGGRHSWNAFKYQDSWYLLDATFGAGRVMEGKSFSFEFNEGLFMVKPELFAMNHFPQDAEWQLLDKPISKNEFISNAWVGGAFFKLGVSKLSHTEKEVSTSGKQDLIIRFSCSTQLKKLDVYNMKTRKRLNNTFSQEDDQCTLVIKSKDLKKGLYMIQTEFGSLISYRIKT